MSRLVRPVRLAWRACALSVFAGVLAGVVWAAPTPSPVRAEIDALLGRLETSGCEFNRNGTWHAAADAKTHLLRKLEAVERRVTLKNAEQFIELAGTSSSSSGQAYQVRCAGAAAMPSAQWLRRELDGLRAAAANKK